MMALALDLSDGLKTRIIDTIRAAVSPLLISRWHIRVGEDHDGEECIFVEVWHPLSATPVGARMMLDAHFAVQRTNFAAGEGRLTYVDHHFADGQQFGPLA
jgi:hypothetical protein